MRHFVNSMLMLAFAFLISCSREGVSSVDRGNAGSEYESVRQQAASVALNALSMWIEENSADSHSLQIQGAKVHEVAEYKGGYHVILRRDNSGYYADGRMKEDGMHFAFFHVYLDNKLTVVRVQRGPDQISFKPNKQMEDIVA